MKQVEKIWAELSAKAQEVETPQESTELSEEVKVELGYIDDVAKDAEKALSKYKDANDIDAPDPTIISSIPVTCFVFGFKVIDA